MSKAEERIAVARRWLGVPFRAHGSTRDGIDCVALTLAVLRGAHEARIDVPVYDMRDSDLLISTFGQFLKWRRHPKSGDFILVRPALGEQPRHVGIYAGQTVIHCSPRRGVVEELYTAAWRRLTHSAWSVP